MASSYFEDKHDAFLSFRGEDTRRGFTSHLFKALQSKGIDAFMDNDLVRGDDICQSLLQKIEQSNASIVVLSENYAGSEWCLDELVKIIDCYKHKGRRVFPVFYRVDPTHIEELSGNFGKGFSKLADMFKDNLEKVGLWRNALRVISGLSGWDSRNFLSEPALIEQIVEDVRKHLLGMYPNPGDLEDDDGLVGIYSRVKEVESLLCNNKSSNVQIIGIWGLGGIGKSIIADKVFHRISRKYGGRYFAANVRDRLSTCQPFQLRDEIICNVLGEHNLNIGTPCTVDPSVRKRLLKKKILIVLDDVSSAQQLKQLIGGFFWLCPGSCIIVTSRDRQVLKNVGTNTHIYEVEKLTDYEAVELFSVHAFKRNHPPKGFMELTRKAISYAQGIPLALRVFGCSLYGKNKDEWRSTLTKLESCAYVEVQKILRISYDGLEQNEKDIFLDIACFFKGEDTNHVECVLEACGFIAKSGICDLVDKSLITVTSEGKVEMHSLVQQMGREIIREHCVKSPEMRSRLWNPRDICHLLKKDLGTPATEGISMDMSKIEEMKLSSKAFANMHNLRIIKLQSCWFWKTRIHLPKGLESLPDELRILRWDQFPLGSLPLNFSPENLVELRMPHSRLVELWSGVKPLRKLKCLDLSYSSHLIRVPDLSRASNLEVLNLKGCIRLVELPLSIQNLKQLTYLNTSDCRNLASLPSRVYSSKLEVLFLRNCANIKELPVLSQNMTQLVLNGTGIKLVPSSIGSLWRLVSLRFAFCTELASLPSSIGKLKCLQELDLNGCSKLANIPDSVCNLQSLETLILKNCLRLNGLPENIGNLTSLKRLYAANSGIKTLPLSLLQLCKLYYIDICGSRGSGVPPLKGWTQVHKLILMNSGIHQIPDQSLNTIEAVIEWHLDEYNFESLPGWDPLAKPTNNRVFEKVEECYRNFVRDGPCGEDLNEKVGHKMIYDFLNEAVSAVLGPRESLSRFRKKIIDSSLLPPSRERKLLDSVWEMIKAHTYRPDSRVGDDDSSGESLTGELLEIRSSSSWYSSIDAEANLVGLDMERLLMKHLIEEIVNDMGHAYI